MTKNEYKEKIEINYQKLCNKVSYLPDNIKSKIFLYKMGYGVRKKKFHITVITLQQPLSQMLQAHI